MNILTLNTTDRDTIHVLLSLQGKQYSVTKKNTFGKSQVTLGMIASLLQKHHTSLSDIDEIVVHPGPGSFTGLRVGITIANVLHLVQGIPLRVLGEKKTTSFLNPHY